MDFGVSTVFILAWVVMLAVSVQQLSSVIMIEAGVEGGKVGANITAKLQDVRVRETRVTKTKLRRFPSKLAATVR